MELFSRRVTAASFLKITAPAVASMVFMSLYCIVDGVFVARLVGENALAAINILLPLINLTFGLGIMLATGGSAVVGALLGRGETQRASGVFSFFLLAGLGLSLLLTIGLGLFFTPLLQLLGATPALMGYCRDYGILLVLSTPAAIIKTLLEYFIRANGDARYSLRLALIGGVTNIALDYVFIVPMGMGIRGAALGTALGYLVPALLGILYFLRRTDGLRLARPQGGARVLGRACANGCSEMVSELATGITTLLFNLTALRYLGEAGLAATTILLYAHYLLNSVYLGFVCGVAPAVSYNHGAGDAGQLRQLFCYSRRFLLVSSLAVSAACVLLSPVLIGVFTPADSPVFSIAQRGMLLFSASFLFMGANVFASGLFTAYGNGAVSALLSFLRAFLGPVTGLLVLPALLGSDGIWLAVPVAESFTVLFSLAFLWKYRRVYRYGAPRRREAAA